MIAGLAWIGVGKKVDVRILFLVQKKLCLKIQFQKMLAVLVQNMRRKSAAIRRYRRPVTYNDDPCHKRVTVSNRLPNRIASWIDWVIVAHNISPSKMQSAAHRFYANAIAPLGMGIRWRIGVTGQILTYLPRFYDYPDSNAGLVRRQLVKFLASAKKV